jgi:membrane protease YdiL (CAAX protease family)
MRNPKGVIAYLILAFGIAWAAWEAPIRLLHVDVTSLQFQLFALPGAFAPAIAALLVRAFTPGGFKDAKLGIKISKWPYFLFALLLPIVIIAAIAVEAQALGIAPAGFDLQNAIRGVVPGLIVPGVDAAHQAQAAAGIAKLGPALIPLMLVNAIFATPILWGEEFGWRGYLQPRLFPGRPLASAVVTGVIWAVWHFPLILRGYDFGHEQAVAGCAAMVVSAIFMSIIFAWLVERTGSIWSSSLAHAATNAVGGSVTILWFGGANNPLMTSYVGILAWPAMFAVCAMILTFGYRRESAQPAAAAAS